MIYLFGKWEMDLEEEGKTERRDSDFLDEIFLYQKQKEDFVYLLLKLISKDLQINLIQNNLNFMFLK